MRKMKLKKETDKRNGRAANIAERQGSQGVCRGRECERDKEI